MKRCIKCENNIFHDYQEGTDCKMFNGGNSEMSMANEGKQKTGSAIFTIGLLTKECYGHGDFGQETRICCEGAYGSGHFPPCFHTRLEAEGYLATMEQKHDKVVVELRLIPTNYVDKASGT